MSSCRNSANPSINKIINCSVLPTGPEGSLVACILVARLTETKQTLVFIQHTSPYTFQSFKANLSLS